MDGSHRPEAAARTVTKKAWVDVSSPVPHSTTPSFSPIFAKTYRGALELPLDHPKRMFNLVGSYLRLDRLDLVFGLVQRAAFAQVLVGAAPGADLRWRSDIISVASTSRKVFCRRCALSGE